MQSSTLRVICGRYTSSLRLSRLDIIYLPLLLLAILVCGTATSCPFPCNTALCPSSDLSSCEHGIVKDLCQCCDVCALGPNERCDAGLGQCGDGLVCVQGFEEGLSDEDLLDYPSFCLPTPTTTASPPSSSTRGEVTTSTADSPATTISEGITSSSPTTIALPLNLSNCTNTSTTPQTCREPCSVNFCSDRARICSAAGLESKKLAKRSSCQHTSCYACFLLVRPNCDHLRCPEPPNKRCLRQYYECIRNHYFNNWSSSDTDTNPVMLKLDDSRALLFQGTIICHIPEVEESQLHAG